MMKGLANTTPGKMINLPKETRDLRDIHCFSYMAKNVQKFFYENAMKEIVSLKDDETIDESIFISYFNLIHIYTLSYIIIHYDM